MNTEAINHDPAITFFQTGSQQPGRPSMGAWVSYGLGSENQNLPAFVVMISQAQRAQHRPAAVLAPVGQRLPAVQPPGREVPRRRRPGAVPLQPAGHRPHHAPRHARRARQAQPHAGRTRIGDPEIETRIAQYEMAYRMQTSVPELTDLSKEPRADLRPVRPGRAQARHLCLPTACWRGGWPSAACASSSSTTAAGTSTTTCRATSRCSAKAPTSPRRRWSRPQAARAARRHAGHLGRRVRPHRLLPGQADRNQLRPRPPPPLLHHVAGRRRHEGRRHARRDRRLLLQRRRRPASTCTTCTRRSCTAWASTTRG